MELHYLFSRKLAELNDCIHSQDDYKLLTSAGILRQLLLDGDKSLLHQLNREKKLRIVFCINDKPPISFPGIPDDAITWFIQDGLCPEYASNRDKKIVNVSLHKFLKKIIIISNGKKYTN